MPFEADSYDANTGIAVWHCLLRRVLGCVSVSDWFRRRRRRPKNNRRRPRGADISSDCDGRRPTEPVCHPAHAYGSAGVQAMVDDDRSGTDRTEHFRAAVQPPTALDELAMETATEIVWRVDNTFGRILLYATAGAGWGLVLYATLLINHFDLFGLRQVWLYFIKVEYTPVKFKETLLYRWLRHPLMLGFIIAFWATPDMTQGHLLFAVVTTAYILLAIQIEERTLMALHGEEYRRYRERVSMIIPLPPKSAT